MKCSLCKRKDFADKRFKYCRICRPLIEWNKTVNYYLEYIYKHDDWIDVFEKREMVSRVQDEYRNNGYVEIHKIEQYNFYTPEFDSEKGIGRREEKTFETVGDRRERLLIERLMRRFANRDIVYGNDVK